mgnify:CR=1 FL=1
MEYRYKIGDAVLVRDDLKYGAFYDMTSGPYPECNRNVVTNKMAELHGRLVHIKNYSAVGQYHVEETGRLQWTDNMFEDPDNNECRCESLL